MSQFWKRVVATLLMIMVVLGFIGINKNYGSEYGAYFMMVLLLIPATNSFIRLYAWSKPFISSKFNVFTTGPHLSPEEGRRLFQEGVRGADSSGIPGTGHGLSFIRHVIELHGGTVGYEPTSEGNNFYFILPAPPVDYPVSA